MTECFRTEKILTIGRLSVLSMFWFSFDALFLQTRIYEYYVHLTHNFFFNSGKNLLATLTDTEKSTLNIPSTHRKQERNVPSITF